MLKGKNLYESVEGNKELIFRLLENGWRDIGEIYFIVGLCVVFIFLEDCLAFFTDEVLVGIFDERFVFKVLFRIWLRIELVELGFVFVKLEFYKWVLLGFNLFFILL